MWKTVNCHNIFCQATCMLYYKISAFSDPASRNKTSKANITSVGQVRVYFFIFYHN